MKLAAASVQVELLKHSKLEQFVPAMAKGIPMTKIRERIFIVIDIDIVILRGGEEALQ
jgi:hypothetical protein